MRAGGSQPKGFATPPALTSMAQTENLCFRLRPARARWNTLVPHTLQEHERHALLRSPAPGLRTASPASQAPIAAGVETLEPRIALTAGVLGSTFSDKSLRRWNEV